MTVRPHKFVEACDRSAFFINSIMVLIIFWKSVHFESGRNSTCNGVSILSVSWRETSFVVRKCSNLSKGSFCCNMPKIGWILLDNDFFIHSDSNFAEIRFICSIAFALTPSLSRFDSCTASNADFPLAWVGIAIPQFLKVNSKSQRKNYNPWLYSLDMGQVPSLPKSQLPVGVGPIQLPLHTIWLVLTFYSLMYNRVSMSNVLSKPWHGLLKTESNPTNMCIAFEPSASTRANWAPFCSSNL